MTQFASTRLRHLAALVATTLASTFLVLALGVSPAAASDSGDLYANTNASRAQNGLAALSWDQAAANIAQSWSDHLAAAQTLSHNPDLASQVSAYDTNQWTQLGENVGVASDANTLEAAFMNSPAHRANILGPYNRVGVGTTRDGSGRMWAAVVFIQAPSSTTAASGSPFGSLDLVSAAAGSLTVQGWAIDPDTTATLEIDVLVDGSFAGYGSASNSRPDVGQAYPAYGPNHGFSFTFPIGGGYHSVCVYAINVGGGSNQVLGCPGVDAGASPFGSLDGVLVGPGFVSLQGWAADPQTAGAVEIDALVDGGFAGYQTADMYRSDIGAGLPAYGPRHGFDFRASVGAGDHQLCVYAINIGAGTNALLACRTITVPASPFGQLDALVLSGGQVWAEGWAIDPQTAQQIEIDVLVDGSLTGYGSADRSRPDVGRAFPFYGSSHGYEAVASMPRGTHSVCVYGINVGVGVNTLLGCRSITY